MAENEVQHGDVVGLGGDVDVRTADGLRAACARYSIGLDTRDTDLFLTAFTPDARLSVEGDPAGTIASSLRCGHTEIAPLPAGLNRFACTHHMLGQHHFWLGAAGPEGSVYGTARHLSRAADGTTDLAMFIRYLDRYAQPVDGLWRIASRRVVIDWVEVSDAR